MMFLRDQYVAALTPALPPPHKNVAVLTSKLLFTECCSSTTTTLANIDHCRDRKDRDHGDDVDDAYIDVHGGVSSDLRKDMNKDENSLVKNLRWL